MHNSKKGFTSTRIPVTRAQIAEATEMSYPTFWRWLKKKGISLPKGLVHYTEQQAIYEQLYGEKYDMK
jgi:hypothetical protein